MVNRAKTKPPSASKSRECGENSEVRKLRNRISQKAFRARQAMRLKELEERVQGGNHPDATRISELQDQNAALRQELLEIYKKLTCLHVSMKTIADASASILRIEGKGGSSESETGSLCSNCKAALSRDQAEASDDLPTLVSGTTQADTSIEDDDLLQVPTRIGCTHSTAAVHGISQEGHAITTGRDATAIGQDPPLDHVPTEEHGVVCQESTANVFAFDAAFTNDNLSTWHTIAAGDGLDPGSGVHLLSQDLGPARYNATREVSPFIASHSGPRRSNSAFSDHIDTLEYYLSCNWLQLDPQGTLSDSVADSIQFMLLTFVNLAWQSMIGWHMYTKAHLPLKALMAWRVTRGPHNYRAIVPAYRPTKLQMAVPYPSIIDWIPWPSLRDKLILRHAANPRLDDLICDIGVSYVVPADLSKLVHCPQPVVGYVGVWNLVRAIAPELVESHSGEVHAEPNHWSSSEKLAAFSKQATGTNSNSITIKDTSEGQDLPASDADALFSSKTLAWQAFKLLGMDKGAFTFYLDPAFYQRHPELYDENDNLMAQGIALQPSQHVPIRAPRQLDGSVLKEYQELFR